MPRSKVSTTRIKDLKVFTARSKDLNLSMARSKVSTATSKDLKVFTARSKDPDLQTPPCQAAGSIRSMAWPPARAKEGKPRTGT